MVIRSLTIFLSFLILAGCSIQSRKDQNDLRKLFVKKEFSKAQKLLKQSSLKEDKKNYLLYLMESGTILYYQEKYKKATRVFVEANELVDKLFTKSIKEALASSVLNDNSKTFYGSIFERSLLYQFQALSFYKLARRGSYSTYRKIDGKDVETIISLTPAQVKKNLDRVRSTLIAWDSFFLEMKRMKGIKTFLKFDLLAKQMAAQMHETLGAKRDKEIALQLYKDAYDILIELGPTQKIFNTSYEKYNAQMKDLYSKKIKRSKVIAKDFTDNYKLTKDRLIFNILKLTKKIRRNQYSKMLRKYSPSKGLKKLITKKSKDNVSIIIEKGLISELEGKDFSYNLRSAVAGIKDPNTRMLVNGIGIPVLTYFALGPLGLGFASHHSGNVTVYSRHNAGEILTKEVGIEFELPYAKPSEESNRYRIEVFQGTKKVHVKELHFLSSLSDISFINAQEMIENSFTKRATRVGIKYVTAIMAAYTTYKTMKDSGGDLFAKPAALAQFLISQKVIKETEKADARHWTTLPASFLNLSLSLNPGSYELHFVEYTEGNAQVIRDLSLGQIKVKSKNRTLFTYRAF